ncbi:MAG: NAD(P)-dependent oxidoreductase [Chloroflexi bacterium]|nr:NAD(P)-dependent oxidoreductase [Chloroflexota bacterium]
MTDKTYIITGALGCIGAWSMHHLIKRGERVVSFDVGDSSHRLDLLLTPEEQKHIIFVKADLSDAAQVLAAFKKHRITHVLHLAALQVPFCRADPVRGAQVNVVGTVNIFEAARQSNIAHIAYASSIAVYGPPSDYPPGAIQHDALPAPRTIYGVYKQANEGTGRIYWQDHQISSTALRPHTVYGIGRDQGLTSDPTKAMLAAALGKPFQLNFNSPVQLQWASDVALQFIAAAEQPLAGAYAFNLGGQAYGAAQIIDMIRLIKPAAQLTFVERTLPFPESTADSALRQHFQTIYATPIEEGVAQTIQHFERFSHDERLQKVING